MSHVVESIYKSVYTEYAIRSSTGAAIRITQIKMCHWIHHWWTYKYL